ncbi:hypothetical protein EI555_008416, partial [Monodon monoceros]
GAMSEQERIQECLRKEIRSLLISTKDGLTPEQLEKEYLFMVGNRLPLRNLGYRSTMELVLDMPDVVSVCPCGDGTVILKAVVKSELKDLLTLSPILLSDFENAFAKRFGRSFQYVQYGFFSMFEALNAAADVISVEQTRAGSLLMLKESLSEEKQRGWPAVAMARFSQPTSNMEPPKQILDVENTSRSNVEISRLNHTEKLNQVVSKFPEGLLISKLLGEFEVIFKEQLSPKKLGFLNVTELVGALSDILHVEVREGEQDLLVFDADMKPLPPDKKIEAKACVSSPPRNSLSTTVIKETTQDCPSENHKEPEEKICKKPNLVVKPLQLEHWTSRAILQFQKLCGLKPLVGVVDEYVDGILNIFLCDTSSHEDVYFHHVLRTEGHAIVCQENVPSKGFRDLNPLTLYTKSSAGPEDIVLTELGFPSQQHYFNEDREINPQSKERELYTMRDINDEKAFSHLKSITSKQLLKDSEFSSLKTQEKSCEDDPKCSISELQDLKEESEDEIPTGMPCLESVTIGDDIWDENWIPLQAEMGEGSDAASHLSTSRLDGKKPYSSCKEMPQKDWCFSTPKDIWDVSWQPSGLVSGKEVEVEKPEGLGAQEKNTGTTGIQNQPNLKSSSDSPTLPELEEFYISLIQSQQSAEGGQFEPSSIETCPKQFQLSTAVLNSTPAVVDSSQKHSGSVESSPESLENEDFSSSHAITVFKDKSQGAMDQLSLILSPEHQISQKLYIPRSTATAALGAAARLATSRRLLHWYPSEKRMEA